MIHYLLKEHTGWDQTGEAADLLPVLPVYRDENNPSHYNLTPHPASHSTTSGHWSASEGCGLSTCSRIVPAGTMPRAFLVKKKERRVAGCGRERAHVPGSPAPPTTHLDLNDNLTPAKPHTKSRSAREDCPPPRRSYLSPPRPGEEAGGRRAGEGHRMQAHVCQDPRPGAYLDIKTILSAGI